MSEETVKAEGTASEVVGAASSDELPATSETPLNEAPATQPEQSKIPKRRLRKTRVGEVVSNKMDKTIVVEVVRRVRHAKFGKIVKRTKKFYAHDEQNSARLGDMVRIRETRPLSKLKRWSLEEIVRRSALGQIEDTATVDAK